MLKSKGRLISFVMALVMLFSLVACAGEEPVTTTDPGVVEETKEPVTEKVTEEEIVTPKNINPLTGLECNEALVGKRPVAVMFNNIREALPQIGLNKCDIIYEVLAEGGILRLEGVMLDYANAGELGSIRSARPYYAELSTAYDAIYVHAGQSTLAVQKIRGLGINNLNGVEGPGSGAFYRNQARLKSGYATEHTMFTDGARIAGGIAALKYRTELNDKNFKAFNFGDVTKQQGSSGTYVKVPHSNYSVSEFRYNADDGLYYHSQYGKAHVDGATGAQIATENVFVLYTVQSINSDGKTRNVTLTGVGKGYYLTGGQVVPILWKRSSETGAFSYTLEDGTPLTVKPGRSYISIAHDKIYSTTTIS